MSRRLWTLVGGVGLLTLVLSIAAMLAAPNVHRGQDFMAFYAAGRLANEGRPAAMYDLDALATRQRDIASASGVSMSASVAPWLNPPWAALPFRLVAALDYPAALRVWTAFGVVCLATSAALLMRIIGEVSPLRRHRWLVPAAILCAPPTWQSLGHGQNTPLSLLLLTIVLVTWRRGASVWAGFACALLCYKPQLAAIVGVALLISCGRRAMLGLALGVTAQLIATILLLPGTIEAFADRMPTNLHRVFVERGFAWHRHATFNGFFRHMIQGNGPGATWPMVVTLTATASAIVALMLVWIGLHGRRAGDIIARDRRLAAVLLATPLLVPYLLDYDLLLLMAAATLIGREMLAQPDATASSRWLRGLGAVTFAWLFINPTLAEVTGVNATVPLLATLFALQARRCLRVEQATFVDDRLMDATTTDARRAA